MRILSKEVISGIMREITTVREHRNPDHVWNADDDLAFLKNMGGYAVERTTGKGWLTAAGLLMFGKGLSVRERFDNIRMDYIDESNLFTWKPLERQTYL